MWEIISIGASGFILLINHQSSDPKGQLSLYYENFSNYLNHTNWIIGITHVENVSSITQLTKDYNNMLSELNLNVPVLPIDPRDARSVTTLLQALTVSIEKSL